MMEELRGFNARALFRQLERPDDDFNKWFEVFPKYIESYYNKFIA